MELFSQRLPDLTLKKFAEKTGFQYVNAEAKKQVICTKEQLDNFLTDGEVETNPTKNPNGGNYERKSMTGDLFVCQDCSLEGSQVAIENHACRAWTPEREQEQKRQTELHSEGEG
jgi:hypothetical protein